MADKEPTPPKLTRSQVDRARGARSQPSVAEKIGWSLLRNSKTGFKFRREHPVGPFRLDFYCVEVRVAIEFDGEQHDTDYDAKRDEFLAQYGILVIRIPNREFFMINGEGKMIDHLTHALKKCEERRAAGKSPSTACGEGDLGDEEDGNS